MNKDLEKFKDGYNPKIDFRIIKFVNPFAKDDIEHFDQLEVFLGKKKAVTKTEKTFENLKKAYDTVSNDGISKEAIEEIAHLLDFDSKKMEILADIDNKQENDLFKAIDIFYFIARTQKFGVFNKAMAILLFNALLKKSGYIPVIFYRYQQTCLFKLVRGGLSKKTFRDILINFQVKSLQHNVRHRAITKEEVVTRFKESQKDLLDLFGITSVSLTGSIIDRTFNDYSDIDMLASFKEGMEKQNWKPAKIYLRKKIGMCVDVIDADSEFAKCQNIQKRKEKVF